MVCFYKVKLKTLTGISGDSIKRKVTLEKTRIWKIVLNYNKRQVLSVWDYYYVKLQPWDKVRIKVSWFGKYDALFIFYDRGFPTCPGNHNTKKGFCFLKFFLAVKIKNDFNMMHIYLFFIKTVMLCCCLDIKFFSIIYILFFFLCIDILRIVLQVLNIVLNLCIIKNYIIASHRI